MNTHLARLVLPAALIAFFLGCNKFKSSNSTNVIPQEAQKAIPVYFQLKCQVVMNPDSNPISLKAESQTFTLQDFSTNKSRLVFNLGPFTLISKVIAEAREHEFVLPPAFCDNIYSGEFSEPARCENGYDLTGLFNGYFGLPASSGSGFIVDFTYQNQKVSYLSYNCNLIDAEEN